MNRIFILCVEDEFEVLDAVVKDLAEFEKVFPVESARSSEEARRMVKKIAAAKDKVGLIICDHIMPDENGVELLADLQTRPETAQARKVLLTGQAGLDATIKAINEAGLNHYIAKPWKKDELAAVIKKELTQYVIMNERNLMPYMGLLDAGKLAEAIHIRGYGADR